MDAPVAEQSDVELLRGVARGDREALGRLYDRHAGTLLALGQRIIGRQRELEDLVHDVFLEAWRVAGDYDPARGSVKTWLSVRMRSRCLDRVRAHDYARTDPLPDLEPVREGDGARGADAAERALDGARVWALLDALPDGQRQVLELGYFRGLSFQEIANELGIPLGTVKSRVGAAILKLRADLGVSRGGNAA
ncbi:MAG: sigma-70 family RNA polymerase sigma factor [Polyangiales bacterium]